MGIDYEFLVARQGNSTAPTATNVSLSRVPAHRETERFHVGRERLDAITKAERRVRERKRERERQKCLFSLKDRRWNLHRRKIERRRGERDGPGDCNCIDQPSITRGRRPCQKQSAFPATSTRLIFDRSIFVKFFGWISFRRLEILVRASSFSLFLSLSFFSFLLYDVS